jgi:3-dehydroquinate synthase
MQPGRRPNPKMKIRPINEARMNIYLYGPCGSGKSTIGRMLAQKLERKFIDLDSEIESGSGSSIEALFADRKEEGFRRVEQETFFQVLKDNPSAVIALGGGTLLDAGNRRAAEESGVILCLTADTQCLLDRLQHDSRVRPLLKQNPQQYLSGLLNQRAEHYASFATALDTTGLTTAEIVWQVQIRLGKFHITSMAPGYDVDILPGSLESLGDALQAHALGGPIALVSDENVHALYADKVTASLEQSGYPVRSICIPAGEKNKNLDTISYLWAEFIRAEIDRSSTVVALGGGVSGDLTGFAAATFLRGVPWVNVPTTLLAMVDASTGGKTGFDLPQGKNLVGAFYAPRLVLTDPLVLNTLPAREIRGGLAEAMKHGVIADPALFALCAAGWPETGADVTALVSRSIAVKVAVIEQDPFEHGLRQSLNLGHTVGHGVELASGFNLSHGECVAIGMVAEARLAEKLGIAETGLSEKISAALLNVGLPVAAPKEISRESILAAMRLDKKRRQGEIHFALPEKIGSVRVGVSVPGWEKLLEL